MHVITWEWNPEDNVWESIDSLILSFESQGQVQVLRLDSKCLHLTSLLTSYTPGFEWLLQWII